MNEKMIEPQDSDRLTKADIDLLISNPGVESKIRIAEKVSKQYNKEQLTESQLKLAEQIFSQMVKHAEVQVRKTLAENLAANSAVPKDLMLALANDVEEVSLPVLEFSDVLNDEELVEIIKKSESDNAQMAIANRKIVSPKVSDALISTKNDHVVENLLQNQGAKISEQSMVKVVESFSTNESVVESMLTRGGIPNSLMKRMTLKVSSAIQKKIETKYGNSFQDIGTVFEESAEIAALKFMAMQDIDSDLMDLIDSVEKRGMLDQALQPGIGQLAMLLDGVEMMGGLPPLSCLAIGHRTLFEISLSRTIGLPFSNVRKLVSDRQKGFKALYDKAEMPRRMYETVVHVLAVIDEMEEAAKNGRGQRPRDNLVSFASIITKKAGEHRIHGLSHFVSLIEHHIESRRKRAGAAS